MQTLMAQPINLKLSVLLLREADMWVAQCLEYDIAAQGMSIPEVKEAFARTLCGQIMIDLHHNVEPLAAFHEAPAEYWQKFKSAERLADRQPLPMPTTGRAIHAVADDLRIAA